MPKTTYISKDRAKRLEESIGWLSNYKGPSTPEEIHIIGESLDKKDEEFTDYLKRLGELNKEREVLLNYFN